MNNPHEHPLIYLSDVKEQELQLLLQLVYFGRTSVYESQLDTCLKVLEDFQLSGIELPERRKTPHLPSDKEHYESNKKNLKESAKRKGTRQNNKNQSGRMVARIEDLGMYECEECDASYPYRISLNRHRESKHEGLKYECDECDFMTAHKRYLRIHKESMHEGVRYECDRCDYKATQTCSLRRHQESKHMKL